MELKVASNCSTEQTFTQTTETNHPNNPFVRNKSEKTYGDIETVNKGNKDGNKSDSLKLAVSTQIAEISSAERESNIFVFDKRKT